MKREEETRPAGCDEDVETPGCSVLMRDRIRYFTGRHMTVIDRNGAPSGAKHVVILNPPITDARSGVRPGSLGLALFAAFVVLFVGACLVAAKHQSAWETLRLVERELDLEELRMEG